MFSIYDGRSEFYQWDKDRKIIVNDKTIKQVHFCNKTDDCSLVCEVYDLDGLRVADVPNVLLTTDWRINVFGYTGDYTKHSACFKVNSRTKPADYVYTETELWTAEKAVKEEVEKVEQALQEEAAALKEEVEQALFSNNLYAPSIINTATGNPIILNDSSESQVKGLKLYNKNLLPLNDITFTGTYTYTLEKPIPAGQYKFYVGGITSTNTSEKFRIGFYSNGTEIQALQVVKTADEVKLSLASPVDKIYLYSGTSYSNGQGHEATWKDMMISVDGGAYVPHFSGGDVAVKVMGKNIANIYGFSANGIPHPTGERANSNSYGTTLSTTGPSNVLEITQSTIKDNNAGNYGNGYFCIGFYHDLKDGDTVSFSFDVEITNNLSNNNDIAIMVSGTTKYDATITNGRFKTTFEWVNNGTKKYIEIRNGGKSMIISNIQVEYGPATEYEPYKEQLLTVPANTKYTEFNTYKPATIITNSIGAEMEVDYVADTKLYIDNRLNAITQAFISLGGNI